MKNFHLNPSFIQMLHLINCCLRGGNGVLRNDAALAGRNNASPVVIVLVSLHLLSEKVETSQSSLRLYHSKTL